MTARKDMFSFDMMSGLRVSRFLKSGCFLGWDYSFFGNLLECLDIFPVSPCQMDMPPFQGKELSENMSCQNHVTGFIRRVQIVLPSFVLPSWMMFLVDSRMSYMSWFEFPCLCCWRMALRHVLREWSVILGMVVVGELEMSWTPFPLLFLY